MVKPKNKNKKNQNEDSEDEVDLDPLAGNTEAQDPAPQSKQGGKKKKIRKRMIECCRIWICCECILKGCGFIRSFNFPCICHIFVVNS